MKKATASAAILATLATTSASAQDVAKDPQGDVPGSAPVVQDARPAAALGYPDEYTLRPLTLASEMTELVVPVMVNLTEGRAGSPIQVMPEIGYGVSNDLELRVVHDRGLCFNGKKTNADGSSADACGGNVYSDFGLIVRYSLLRNSDVTIGGESLKVHLAGQGGLIVKNVSPDMLAIRLGMLFKLVVPKFIAAPMSVYLAPTLDFGLGERGAGNKEFLNIPEIIAFQATPWLPPFMLTGIRGPLQGFGGNYDVPMGIGVNLLVHHGVDIGAEFVLPRFMSGASGGGTDNRLALAYLTFRG
jgi:hypothetical protein